MSTPKTPYDAEILDMGRMPYRNEGALSVLRDRQKGYRRALDDVRPRMDALVAALHQMIDMAEVGHSKSRHLNPESVKEARAALALAEDTPTS